MNADGFPPEDAVKAIVEDELPTGTRLKGISFTFGSLATGLPESFMVVIELIEDEAAIRSGSPGLGYAITQRIRTQWSRDDLYVKIVSMHDERQ